MIVARGVRTARGEIDLHVAKGDVILLRGPNGSGKTSLLRALAGLDTPHAPPAVLLDGRPPRDLPAAAVPNALAYAPQEARDALVGLTLAGEARLRGRALPEILAPLAAREVATLSSGEARRATHALLPPAPVLLLDEPGEGLDAAGRARVRALVREAATRGAVVAADHGELLDDLATRVVLLGAETEDADVKMPPQGSAVVVHADPARLRGRDMPARAWPAGLHVITGGNGSGKSTLLLRLAGLLAPEGVRISGAPARPGVARHASAHARDTLTRERVAEELRGAMEDTRRLLVPDALLARHPLTLSGGEAQRVSLARCLGRPASCYLLDEPEAHLDAAGRAALLRVVARRIAEGACVIAATHDARLQAIAHTRTELPP